MKKAFNCQDFEDNSTSIATLSEADLMELDAYLEAQDALKDFDLQADDATLAKDRRLALMKETKERLHSDALRNGKRATEYKMQQRADYAAMIRDTEGREVRGYKKATPERRKAQKKQSKDNRSEEQKNKERAADNARKAAKRKQEREAAVAAAAIATADAKIF